MSRVAAMQAGDRAALRLLLEERGLMLDALVDGLNKVAAELEAEPGLDSVEELSHSLWRARLMADEGMDELAFIGAFAFFKLAPNPMGSSTPAINYPVFYQLVGRVACGAGNDLDARILQEQCEGNPELAELKAQLEAVLEAALNTKAGPPSEFSTWWPRVESKIAPAGS